MLWASVVGLAVRSATGGRVREVSILALHRASASADMSASAKISRWPFVYAGTIPMPEQTL